MLSSMSFLAVAAGEPNPMASFAMMLVPMMLIWYFLVIRPHQKRQQESKKMIEGLKKGDKIVTSGGLIGIITSIQNDYVVLRAGDNEQTKLEVLKSAVLGLRQ
jgi:preprotein translocase subunit YajC